MLREEVIAGTKIIFGGGRFGKGGWTWNKAYILDRNTGRTVELALVVAEEEYRRKPRHAAFLFLFLDTRERKKRRFPVFLFA